MIPAPAVARSAEVEDPRVVGDPSVVVAAAAAAAVADQVGIFDDEVVQPQVHPEVTGLLPTNHFWGTHLTIDQETQEMGWGRLLDLLKWKKDYCVGESVPPQNAEMEV